MLLSIEFLISLLLKLCGGLVVAILLIVVYLQWTYKYWLKLGVQCPEPEIPYGNMKENIYQQKTFGQTVASVYKDMKAKNLHFAGFYFLHMPCFVPIDLELIKRMLQSDFHHFMDHGLYYNERDDPLSAHLFSLEGAKWKNLRNKLSPTFTPGKIKMMFPIMYETTKELLRLMDSLPKDEPVEVKEISARLTTDIIGTCAFGIHCNSLLDPNTEFRAKSIRLFKPTNYEFATTFMCFLFPNVMRFFGVRFFPEVVANFFWNVIRDNTEYREKNDLRRNDFFQLLLDLKNNHNKENDFELSFQEMAAQAFVFFSGGFESSSSTMCFALMELSQSEEIQNKLRNEINDVLNKYNGEITYEALSEMHYMDMVINETLRKYLPLPILLRMCTEDYQIPNTDIIIKKGTMSFIPVEGIHYDPEFYPNPDVFDPNRFNEENNSQRHHFAFLPFGEGPRICIGLRFGLMQTKIGLCTMIKNYKFSLNPKTKLPIQMNPKHLVNTPTEGIWIDIAKCV